MTDFSLIYQELHKLTKMPAWGRVQGDHWDRLSRFVYSTETLRELWQQVETVAHNQQLDVHQFGAYAVRRWYNHHTHDAILRMFYAHPTIRPEENRRHRTVDFYLRDLPFDLKISRFPHAYPHSIEAARRQPHHLALWQYQHQSKQGRYHTGNRIFVVLHHPEPARVWELRRDFEPLAELVTTFLKAPTLLGLTLPQQPDGQIARPWSAIIFYGK